MASQWQEMIERRERIKKMAMGEDDPAKCPKCECEFFEMIEVQQIKLETVAMGSKIPSAGQFPIYLAKCLKCGTLNAPVVDVVNRPKKEQELYEQCIKIVNELNKKE